MKFKPGDKVIFNESVKFKIFWIEHYKKYQPYKILEYTSEHLVKLEISGLTRCSLQELVGHLDEAPLDIIHIDFLDKYDEYDNFEHFYDIFV